MLELTIDYSLFFRKRGAFSFGLAFIIGSATFFYPLTFLLVFFIFLSPRYFISGIILGFFYAYAFSPNIDKPLEGEGVFIPKSVTPIKSLTYSGFVISGNIPSFFSEKKEYKNIPASLYTNFENKDLMKPFKFIGKVEEKNNKVIITPKDTQALNRKNLSFFRHNWKKKMEKFLKKNIRDKEAYSFLSALVTGHLTDLFVKFSFFRLGLSHILAISGFHFSLLIGLISLPLFFLPIKTKSALLILIATLYFLFMGPSPSITRAYVMICLFYLGKYSDRLTCPINNLGLAGFFIVLYDPKSFSSLSFQLSFLSCLGIFFFYPFFHRLIPQKKGIMGKLYRFYIQAICLSISVNMMILPILLYLFHKVSLLGMIFNLFFPIQVVLCFTLLIFSLFLAPIIPILSQFLFWILNIITKMILIPVLNPPMYFDFYLRHSLSKEVAIVMTIFVFLLGIYVKVFTEKKGTEKIFSFL